MAPFIEMDNHLIRTDFHHTPRLDKPTVQLLGHHLLITTQPPGQPAIATVRQNRQGGIQARLVGVQTSLGVALLTVRVVHGVTLL